MAKYTLLFLFAVLSASIIVTDTAFMKESAVEHQEVLAYFKQRTQLIDKSESVALGAHLNLEDGEIEVNRILMEHKNKDFDSWINDTEKCVIAKNFFQAKPYIQNSCVFKIIQKLPKGSSLHAHDTSIVSDEYVFENITNRENLYATEDPFSLKFFKKHPGTPWRPISEWRKMDQNFDARLKQRMTLAVDNPEIVYPDLPTVWTAFQNIFSNIEPMLTYKPVFKEYYYQALKELYEDNIRYFEMRGDLPELYDLDGKTYGYEDVIDLYYTTSQEFLKDYPDFWGIKFIFAPPRFTTLDVVETYVDFIKKMNEKYPNFIAGFDLVGQEDTGAPLKDFIPALLKLKSITKLFFHAGETLGYGLRADMNLFDAILLNTSRIGHGYAIWKHPELLRIVKDKNIPIEIAPISNQVLGLTKDIRNHPGNFLIAHGYPVVIAQDDPGFWGAKAVSYDWYYAFMGMSSRNSDLRLLKQLAINSIVYSSMEPELKQEAMKKWKEEWNHFLHNITQEDLADCT